MNYVLFFLFVIILYSFYRKQGFMTRANSFDISNYASKEYPCVNENKLKQHSQP